MPQRTREHICADLDVLTSERGFVYSLALIVLHDLFLDPAEAADIDWRSRLSYQEITFLTGLLVKRRLQLEHPAPEDVQRQVTRAYELFEELHAAHGDVIMQRMAEILGRTGEEGRTVEESTREFFGSGSVMTEPIFYSGSGAYDFQYTDLGPRRYRLDREWLHQKIGLDLDDAATIVREIKTLRDLVVKEPDFDAFLDAVFSKLCVAPRDFPDHPKERVEAFFRAFSLEPGEVNEAFSQPGQYNRVDSHPLIALGNDEYFLPVHFNLARSMYESPFYWMLADGAYRDTASANRGETTETITADMLKTVFGHENVYRGVELRRGSSVVGEIDALAVLGRKGLIVQCKSKRLTELARLGDTQRLTEDFAAAVQAAYDQGLSCRNLLRDPNVEAVAADGSSIEADLDDAFIACVLSDHYPSLTHQVHVYLERDTDAPYPISVGIFDLELLCHYLRDPFEFMYYVRQRTELAEYFRADEEMSLLAYHLKKKLFAVPGADVIAITSDMAQLIDANYPAARGEHPQTEASTRLFHEWKNEHYDRLVADLKDSDEHGFVDAVFMLFDFSGDAVDRIFAEILRAKERTRQDRQKHSIATISDTGDAGISLVTRADDHDQLERDNLVYAQLKKHQTRATEWLGLGSLAASSRIADVVVYNRDPWEPDDVLDELVERNLGSGTVRRLMDKLGRNDPCWCGSGLKYKRCHGA